MYTDAPTVLGTLRSTPPEATLVAPAAAGAQQIVVVSSLTSGDLLAIGAGTPLPYGDGMLLAIDQNVAARRELVQVSGTPVADNSTPPHWTISLAGQLASRHGVGCYVKECGLLAEICTAVSHEIDDTLGSSPELRMHAGAVVYLAQTTTPITDLYAFGPPADWTEVVSGQVLFDEQGPGVACEVSPRHVTAVTALSWDPTGTNTWQALPLGSIEADDWQVTWRPSQTWQAQQSPAWPTNPAAKGLRIRAQYTAGYAPIPAILRLAATFLAANRYTDIAGGENANAITMPNLDRWRRI